MTALARRTDPSTSHDAAASVNLTRSRQIVLTTLGYSAMTDDDLVWLCRESLSPSRARTARKELVDLGLVRSTGRTERLRSGRHATVWEVATP